MREPPHIATTLMIYQVVEACRGVRSVRGVILDGGGSTGVRHGESREWLTRGAARPWLGWPRPWAKSSCVPLAVPPTKIVTYVPPFAPCSRSTGRSRPERPLAHRTATPPRPWHRRDEGDRRAERGEAPGGVRQWLEREPTGHWRDPWPTGLRSASPRSRGTASAASSGCAPPPGVVCRGRRRERVGGGAVASRGPARPRRARTPWPARAPAASRGDPWANGIGTPTGPHPTVAGNRPSAVREPGSSAARRSGSPAARSEATGAEPPAEARPLPKAYPLPKARPLEIRRRRLRPGVARPDPHVT